MMVTGCASSITPIAYYGLHAVDPAVDHPPASQLTIGIGPVRLPDYLDRSAIVTRLSPNRLQINENHRWAGSLQSEILRVLAINLKRETGARQVATFPWSGNLDPDIRFRISIHAFEGQPASKAKLKATWTMTRNAHNHKAVLYNSDIAKHVDGKDLEAVTETMGDLLAEMSNEMASAILTGK
jgi:uncharacterized lipoprotein YmbA